MKKSYKKPKMKDLVCGVVDKAIYPAKKMTEFMVKRPTAVAASRG